MAEKLPESLVKALSDKLEEIRIEEGLDVTKSNSKLLSKLRKKVTLPEGFRISSLNEFFRNRQKNPNAVLKFVPQGTDKGNKVRKELEDYPGQQSRIIENELRRNTKTNQLKEVLSDLGYDDALIDKYFYDTDKDLKALLKEVATKNKTLPPGQKISFGHENRLSKSINSPRNVFIELLDENILKGDRYSLNPAGQLATGNPTKEGLSWLENWKRDFLIYADRTEHGGTGVLPQRGNYSDLLQQKFRELTGTQWDKLDDASKLKAIEEIDDLTTASEKLNQFTVNQGKLLKKYGLLTPKTAAEAIEWANDLEVRKMSSFPHQVTELGSRLGGIGNKIKANKVVGVLSEGANTALKFADKATGFIPKPLKKRALPLVSLVTDAAQVVAAPNELDKGTESEIGTTNYMRNRYTKAGQDLDRLGGGTGIAALAPGPQQGLLSMTSMLSYMAGSRARHLGENYKSDVDKVTEDLFPSTTPGFSGVGRTELKQGKKSVLEDIKTKYNNWIYGIN